MSGTIAARLTELGITLPQVSIPRGNYLPVVITGSQAWVAGQVPFLDNEIQFVGRVGEQFSVEDGQAAARLCFLNMLAQLEKALDGNLDRIRRIVKLGGFVNCTPEFTQHPLVINGASDLAAEIFGDAGRHARFAVGAPSLPLGVAVEIDGVFDID